MKWLYRSGSLCAVCAITLSLLIVPASAESVSTSMSFVWNRGGNLITGTFAVPRYDSSYVGKRTLEELTAGNKYYTSVDEFALDVEQMYSGAVGMYISYYYNCDTSVGGEWFYQPSVDYDGYYTNDVGGTGSSPTVDFSTFNPASGTNPSTGFRMSVQFAGEPSLPISGLGVKRVNSVAQAYFVPAASTSADCNFYLNVPSATIVGTATSEELSALEGMADSIAAQNEILNAMYGDIVSICNSIYERTGDLVAAQNLTNQYFAQIIPILNAIQTNTGTTATNTSNIYSLLASQFTLLISTIQSESFDIQEVLKGESQAIQDAVDAAADKIILYLDTAFAGAVGDTPESVKGADDAIRAEHEFTNGMFNDIDQNIDLALPNQYVPTEMQKSAFPLIGGLIGNMYDCIGELGFIWLFGWVAGLCAFFLGRLRRFAG